MLGFLPNQTALTNRFVTARNVARTLGVQAARTATHRSLVSRDATVCSNRRAFWRRRANDATRTDTLVRFGIVESSPDDRTGPSGTGYAMPTSHQSHVCYYMVMLDGCLGGTTRCRWGAASAGQGLYVFGSIGCREVALIGQLSMSAM